MFHKNHAKDKKESKDEEDRNWIPDHKHKQCMLCTKHFSMLIRRHHCRKCGCLICNDCSKNKWPNVGRICDSCFKLLSRLHYQPIVHCNPYLQILSEANFFKWIATFEKSWIRSRYPNEYNKYKKELLEQRSDENKAQTPTKPTPKVIDKRSQSLDEFTRYQRPRKEKYQSTLKQSASAPKLKLKKKKYNPLIVVQTGLLYINIMEAQGLPDCDMFSQPDGYCIYYVTNNDPCFGATTKYSTKVQHNTYEPVWNEDETLVISNTTGKLVIELWDYDIGDCDDYLGKVCIELNDLFLHFSCNQPRHSIIDDWFEVDLAEEWKKEKHKEMSTRKSPLILNTESKIVYKNPHSALLLRQKYLSTYNLSINDADQNDDEYSDNLSITAVYKKLQTMPLLSLSDTFDENTVKGKCYIHLQLKLRATNWGHFISMFDPLLPLPPKQEPFDVNRFYAELNTLLSYVYPMMSSSQTVIDTLFWVKYIWASVYVLMYGYCVFNPWFAVFWIQFRTLIYCCDSYLKQTVLSEDGIGNKDIVLPTLLHCLCICIGIIPTVINTICSKNKELMDKDIEDITNDDDDDDNDVDIHKNEEKSCDERKEEDISMNVFTRIVGNNVIRVSGLKNNLGWYQELLVWINEMIRYILDLFTWKYVGITSVIVIGLSVSCLLLVIFENTALYQYQVFVIGTAIMAYFSKPIQFLQWFLCGMSRWYYQYYVPYKKFKTEIASSEPYISDDEEEEEQNRTTSMDNNIKTYLCLILEKLTIMCYLCMDLLFGMIIFIKPIFNTSNKKTKDEGFKPAPLKTTATFKPPPLKRANIMQNESVYLSADAISTGSGRSIKSKQETARILKSKTYNTNNRFHRRAQSQNDEKSIIRKFGTMFGHRDDEQNKRKQKKKIRKAKTLKKQPTLLRKKTLKQIESKADSKIDGMMTKLHAAKSVYTLF